jgi:hypothetical protein
MFGHQQQEKNSDQSLSGIATWINSNQSLLRLATWSYIFIILWDVIDSHPPYVRADRTSQLQYEVYGFILGIPPLVLAAFLLKNSPVKQELQKVIPVPPLWAMGFFLVICAITMKNAFTLSLQFFLPNDTFTRIVSTAIETAIPFLKWGGLGILAWAQLQSLRQKILASETDENKIKSQILYGLAVVLFTVLIAYGTWREISGIVEYWF